MSAVYLKLTAVLCLSCTALSGTGSSGVVWRDFGEAFTIQCRYPQQGQSSLSLEQGLSERKLVLFKYRKSEKISTAEEFSGRLQLNGVFPNLDILIKNLTSNDTGTYWCMYNKFDGESTLNVKVQGSGSVLLVVTDTRCDDQSDNNNLILVSVVICVATLLGIIICFLIWIILKVPMCFSLSVSLCVCDSQNPDGISGAVSVFPVILKSTRLKNTHNYNYVLNLLFQFETEIYCVISRQYNSSLMTATYVRAKCSI
ncbi:uncharacterized protein LOC116397108 isoform X2 [Anarrhichthys ocellatus]|uniref:uncharacterized protein LOC116397108 isoform X2 n=1 Tax=Anarrhichthys ocellatus TaxID=433405 RepID=UPI0012EE172A|nr:uncharacterized protein LOC116397108 isoform X2 [Anarrhichthys ocellatus]